MWKMGYPERLARMEGFVERVFRRPEILYVNNTCQFDEYGKYVASRFNEEEKLRYREEHFPEDCRKAYQLGEQIARNARPHI